MAKKQHSNAPPNPHSVPNREIMQRLNFLYQASSWLSSLPTTKGSAAATRQSKALAAASSDPKGKKEQANKAPHVTPAYLSRAYAGSMKAISQKVVVKLDPSVKRTICKGCDSPLIPGMTATVRSKHSPSHKKLISILCLNCKTVRRIPAPPLSQDASEPPSVPESAMKASGTGAKGRGRKRRGKVMYKQPFFERPEHILFRGNQIVDKTGDPMPSRTTVETSVSVEMETDATSTQISS